MILSLRSKALKAFFLTGDASKLPVPNHDLVRRQLAALNVATLPEQLNVPGWRFHGLQGKPKRYAIDASGNYLMTFVFDGPDAEAVDLADYH